MEKDSNNNPDSNPMPEFEEVMKDAPEFDLKTIDELDEEFVAQRKEREKKEDDSSDDFNELFGDFFDDDEKSIETPDNGPKVYSVSDESNFQRAPLHPSENVDTLADSAAEHGVSLGQFTEEEKDKMRELDTNAKSEQVKELVEAYSNRGVVRDREMAKKVFDILETEPQSVFGIFKHRLFQGVRNLEDDASEPYDGEIYTDIVLLDEALSRGVDFSKATFDVQYRNGGEEDVCDVETILSRMKAGLDKKISKRRIDPDFVLIKDPFDDNGGQRKASECLDELIAKFDKQSEKE